MTNKLFTEVEASHYLNISRKTLSQHRKAGKINPIRFGKGWCYSQADLDNWRTTYGNAVTKRQVLATAYLHN